VLGPVDTDDLGLRNGGKPLSCFVGLEVVVVLRDERDHRLARLRPGGQVLVGSEPQRR
jgi:hypothetical protein